MVLASGGNNSAFSVQASGPIPTNIYNVFLYHGILSVFSRQYYYDITSSRRIKRFFLPIEKKKMYIMSATKGNHPSAFTRLASMSLSRFSMQL